MQRGERWAREQGLGTLSADVSLAARAFFEAMGFGVVQAECVERRGVRLRNFRMTKKNASAID
jgi:putative acetyltransferase